MINIVTVEDLEEMDARLRIVEGSLTQLQKEHIELVTELKKKLKDLKDQLKLK